MSDTFTVGPGYQGTSDPYTVRQVQENDLWPILDNSGSGTKDSLFDANGNFDGVHPCVAVGGRTAADGRPLNRVGVVISATPGLTVPTSLVRINIGDGFVFKNYVANVLTYAAGVPATFETAPVPGQPVYVDDSDDLGEGVTLSMSPLNDADVKNPLAGYLTYGQTEYPDQAVGGPNETTTFDSTLANSLVEQEYWVELTSGVRELA